MRSLLTATFLLTAAPALAGVNDVIQDHALPGTARDYDPESNESLADFVKRQNLGSFTLGPIEVNGLELSNVAATIASGGVWCPPNPIESVFDRHGNEVAVTVETCEQVVPEGLANTLANALGEDDRGAGTAAGAKWWFKCPEGFSHTLQRKSQLDSGWG